MSTGKRQIPKGPNERDPAMKGLGWSGHTRYSIAYMADQLEALLGDTTSGLWGEDGYLTEKGGEALYHATHPQDFTV